jgi:hypothetical protein
MLLKAEALREADLAGSRDKDKFGLKIFLAIENLMNRERK